jgi:acetyltransferase-like isoleucine patch superfamily enzyme
MVKNFFTLEIKRSFLWVWYRFIFFKKNIKIGYANSIINSDFGVRVSLSDFVVLNNVFVDSYTYIAKNGSINNAKIGKFCSIGQNVMIGQGIHPTNFVSTHPIFYSTRKQSQIQLVSRNRFIEYKNVVIGNDVWIGSNVIICDGVKIDNGAIIGAGSVVRRNVNAYEVVIGNPAKVIRKRFSCEIIKKLLNNPWWAWEDDKIFNNVTKFKKIETFIKIL